ncbi:STAS domain-containing protein [Nonomuraea sp. NPDC048916]|uniref:STAS domain-containing protein n=1 Tax=Nonomuraea sp. NPDC048916 TaxID=3154232 RepID=UPI0033DCC8A3
MLDKRPLQIEIATPDQATVRLALRGDLAYDTVAQLAALAPAAGYRVLEVDLSELSFIDSSSLAALIRLHQQAELADAALHVVALTPHLRSMLRITALDQLLVLPPL